MKTQFELQEIIDALLRQRRTDFANYIKNTPEANWSREALSDLRYVYKNIARYKKTHGNRSQADQGGVK